MMDMLSAKSSYARGNMIISYVYKWSDKGMKIYFMVFFKKST